MSDNIPFEIQLEIIKRVYDVKSLIRFRAVSKPWKSFIETSDFIAGYGARHTHPQTLLLRYKDNADVKYLSFVDEIDILAQHDFAPNVTDQMKQFNDLRVIGSSNGLLCLRSDEKRMLVLWNPSIRKSVSIKLPYLPLRDGGFLGFMVCPVTNDPTIVMITTYPWQVGTFTLNTKRCTVFQYTKLPEKAVKVMSSQVVIDRCIYWAVYEIIPNRDDGSYHYSYMIMSFDLIAKEIRLVDIPRSILNKRRFFISKLRESLVLFVPNIKVGIPICGVWKMEDDESFTKLLTIRTPDYTINNILGFGKNGELVMETQKEDEEFAALEVYEPCSERISNLGIYGEKDSFSMGSYKETLLLLDELDCCVCSKIN